MRQRQEGIRKRLEKLAHQHVAYGVLCHLVPAEYDQLAVIGLHPRLQLVFEEVEHKDQLVAQIDSRFCTVDRVHAMVGNPGKAVHLLPIL